MASAPLDPLVWGSEVTSISPSVDCTLLSAGVPPADTHILQNVTDHFNARYIASAGLTLMIWSHLTTFDTEIKYIWKNGAGVTLNKTLFCVVRYFATVIFGFVLEYEVA